MVAELQQKIEKRLGDRIQSLVLCADQLSLEINRAHLREVCQILRDDPGFRFDLLIDICGVDYLDYGISEWFTDEATASGFGRGVDDSHHQRMIPWEKPRFGVVYHLLSIAHNQRLRLRVFAEEEPPRIDSVVDIWASANWYEREAFDLFGILFEGHPDLRRILTDYGFIGYPFRKDFPLIGHVEVRYDAALGRVIYEPVNIEPRTLVPKVIREDNRYESAEGKPRG